MLSKLNMKEKHFYKNYNSYTNIKTLKELNFQEYQQNLKNYEYTLYSDSLKSYNEMITSLAYLYKKLKINNQIDIFTNFCYMLWTGYLSQNRKYIYQYKNRKNLESCLGADIINGHGVCLNNASLLNDLFLNLEYESYFVITKSKSISLDYETKINQNKTKNLELIEKIMSIPFSPFTIFNGNHACVLVKKENVYYLYDPTRLCIYKLDNFLSATLIGGHGKVELNPKSLKIYNELKNYEIVDIIESYQNKDPNPYTLSIIDASFNISSNPSPQKEYLLNKYYLKMQENRSRVLKIFKN